MVLTGDTVHRATAAGARSLVLIAPAASDHESVRSLLRGRAQGVVLLPAFDEDGRVHFWKELPPAAITASLWSSEVLEGVGTQVEWSWEQVVACIDRLKM